MFSKIKVDNLEDDCMMTMRTEYQITAKLTDHLIVPDLSKILTTTSYVSLFKYVSKS